MENGESLAEAAIRETLEETGYHLSKPNLVFIKTIYVDYGRGNTFEFTLYHSPLVEKPPIHLETSHTEYAWMTVPEALGRNDLIQDFEYCIKGFDSFIKKNYAQASH